MILRMKVFDVGTPTLAVCTYDIKPGQEIGISIPADLIRELSDPVAPVLAVELMPDTEEPSWTQSKGIRRTFHGADVECDGPFAGSAHQHIEIDQP